MGFFVCYGKIFLEVPFGEFGTEASDTGLYLAYTEGNKTFLGGAVIHQNSTTLLLGKGE